MKRLKEIEDAHIQRQLPEFSVGDTVKVEFRIREGDKERIQPFIGDVIAMRGGGLRRTFTVRRIVQGEGVERIFPYHSPRVANVTVQKRGRVRRAKLYYLRGRTGKRARIREKIVPGSTSRHKSRAPAEAPAEPPPAEVLEREPATAPES